MPYVIYASGVDFRPSYVSTNVEDLLAVSAKQFLGGKIIWQDIVPPQDQVKFFGKFGELEQTGEVTFTHRIVGTQGLPIWVSHRIRGVLMNGVRNLTGWITPIASSELCALLEPSMISSFIHKLGNHFQLMNLVLDSARKAGIKALDINAMQETLDKSIELTRAFSEFTQLPAWVSAFALLEAVDNATSNRSTSFDDSRVEFERQYEPAIKGLTVQGDPYLLELAITAILQNAVEATQAGGKITVNARLKPYHDSPAAVKLVVTDEGVGIQECNLPKVTLPFFSTKANHDGLGLSMAARFVEIHGGILNVNSEMGKGTEVEILLPINGRIDDVCH